MGIAFEQLNKNLQHKIPYSIHFGNIKKEQWILNKEDGLYHCTSEPIDMNLYGNFDIKLYLNGAPVLFDYDIVVYPESNLCSIDLMVDTNIDYDSEIKLYKIDNSQ